MSSKQTDEIITHRIQSPMSGSRRYVWLLATLLASGAVALTFIASLGCHLYSLQSSNRNNNNSLAFGPWSFDEAGNSDSNETWFGCTAWGSSMHNRPDKSIRAIQGLTITVCILSMLVYILVVCMSFFKYEYCTLRIAAGLCFVLCPSLVMYNLVLLSDLCRNSNECYMDSGGKIGLGAALLWMFTGHLLLLLEDMLRRHASEPSVNATTITATAIVKPKKPKKDMHIKLKSIAFCLCDKEDEDDSVYTSAMAAATPTNNNLTVTPVTVETQRDYFPYSPSSHFTPRVYPVYEDGDNQPHHSLEVVEREYRTSNNDTDGESMASWSLAGESVNFQTNKTMVSV